nr:MAG TPA: hypothetical protein [Caudoviricetes sp.]
MGAFSYNEVILCQTRSITQYQKYFLGGVKIFNQQSAKAIFP